MDDCFASLYDGKISSSYVVVNVLFKPNTNQQAYYHLVKFFSVEQEVGARA
jgi:hypothetical protein